MNKVKVGDAAISESGVICIIIDIKDGYVYYKRDYDGYSKVLTQTVEGWISDFKLGYKPITFNKTMEYLYL